jgi:hypothetical protein
MYYEIQHLFQPALQIIVSSAWARAQILWSCNLAGPITFNPVIPWPKSCSNFSID